MKITLVMVQSADGKTTAGHNTHVHDWTSKEDQSYFVNLVKKSPLVVMGRKTYEQAKEHMVLSPDTLRVVLTKNPLNYRKQTVAGQLEFSKDTPKEIVRKLADRGFKKMVLVGGSEINTLFLKEGMISALWLTVEPVLLGSGTSLLAKYITSTPLLLQQVTKLNKKGTLLLRYRL